jgi:3-phenylpropionate/trans-cinnamate dioxygenase ferredoxin reductase component
MDAAKFVILGGGMVAGYAARQLVELGIAPGELAILSADTSVPYERPPLSKGFLAGRDSEESIRINPEDFYRQHGIEMRLGCTVSGVDAETKRLSLASGSVFGFEKLIVATGARPRVLDIPGARLSGVHYLRSLDDSKAIRRAAANVKRAVVIGGAFIGMEVAAVLAQKGVEVAMVLRGERIWQQFFTPQMSSYFEAYCTARGVRFVKTAVVKELRGGAAVSAAVLDSGQALECEMLAAGIGVLPVTEPLAGSGIELENGVQVNEYLETNRPGIWAAGDVANYQDVLFGKRRRVEHWDNAVSQGQHCARALVGERAPFRHVPYFFSDVFDLSYEFWGDPSGAEQTVHRGDVPGGSFSVWWLRRGVLVAAFTMNRPDEERETAPKWIEGKQAVSAAKLEDASRAVSEAVG